MLPIIRLSQAWLDARGWSLAEGTLLLELDQTAAVQAGAGDVCPRCTRSHTEYQLDAFVSDSATVNSEHERGRRYVLCICGATYWYAAVDDLNAPTDDARVRAASVTRTPGTGALRVDGQGVQPVVAAPPPMPVGQQSFDLPIWGPSAWHPAYSMPPNAAAAIWAAVEKQRNDIAAKTAHLRHNQAND